MTDLEFQVGDYVYLRVAARKALQRTPRLGKLAPRYVGPFRITERIGPVAYRLELPPQLAGLHPVFHVSMLRKSEKRIGPSIVDYQDLEILTDVSVEERPVRISDRREKVLRGKVIPLVKVHWTHRGDEEATWEREDLMREQYPEAFPDAGTILISRTKFL